MKKKKTKENKAGVLMTLSSNGLSCKQTVLILSYAWPPSQNPVFLIFHTDSVFLLFCKLQAPVTDTFFASRVCPLMRAPTVFPAGDQTNS